jgi:hypothetical protein
VNQPKEVFKVFFKYYTLFTTDKKREVVVLENKYSKMKKPPLETFKKFFLSILNV